MGGLQTIAQTITIGRAATYLMANDLTTNGELYGKKIPKPTTPILLQYVTDALAWQFIGNPGDPTLRGTANYAIWLYGIYGAQTIGRQGDGTVIPIPPVATPSRLDFYVTASTPVTTGESSVTLLQFVGYNLQFERNNIPQATVTDGSSSYFTWNKQSGVFTCYPAANFEELFSLIPYV